MAGWTVIVGFLFPIPLVALLLLSLPLPGFIASPVRKFVNWILQKILFAGVIGKLSLFHIALLLSAFLFVDASWETYKADSQRIRNFEHGGNTAMDERLKCSLFRFERNFWIALFSLTLWIILYRVYKFTTEIEKLKAELQEKKSE
jgi:hypothetical protein